ncbi:MAG: phosphoribosylanthranilate isomerase [Acidobacteria bacterium]|nr:phosphoribosylanthranilate isomerase [Acidobacteriota bacterium]
MTRALVKICGLRRPEDARAAVAAGADLLGFVFVPGTPRALDPERALWIREIDGAARVGVFRDQPLELILDLRRELDLDWVQLHGSEPEAYLDRLGPRVLRRVPLEDPIDWRGLRRLAGRCLPLLDPGAGDGVAFDPALFEGRPGDLRFGVAGGLTPRTVGELVRRIRPALVDVSSGVERAPGSKDPGRMEAFVRAVRAAGSGALQSGADRGDDESWT